MFGGSGSELGRCSASFNCAGCRGHLWSCLRTLVVWTGTSIWTVGLAGAVFNVLIVFSVTVSIARVVVMTALINTLPVDQIILALTVDIVRIFFIISA